MISMAFEGSSSSRAIRSHQRPALYCRTLSTTTSRVVRSLSSRRAFITAGLLSLRAQRLFGRKLCNSIVAKMKWIRRRGTCTTIESNDPPNALRRGNPKARVADQVDGRPCLGRPVFPGISRRCVSLPVPNRHRLEVSCTLWRTLLHFMNDHRRSLIARTRMIMYDTTNKTKNETGNSTSATTMRSNCSIRIFKCCYGRPRMPCRP
jgi:hypothetical protein